MSKAIKHSKQREALLDLLRSTTSHPSADWLYTQLRCSFPNISLGTVYRNLKLLSDNGTIIRLEAGTGTEHYDGQINNHYHFICHTCGEISDVDMDCLPVLEDNAAKKTGAQIDRHSLVFYGQCKKCKNI